MLTNPNEKMSSLSIKKILLPNISSIHLFLCPFVLRLWLPQLRQPLLYCGNYCLGDINACRVNIFRLFVVVNNPFTPRKDSYSLLPVDGTLSILLEFFEESVLGFMQNCYVWKTLGVLLLDSNLCPHWVQFMKWTLYLWASQPRRYSFWWGKKNKQDQRKRHI